jgi:hypothetical protein
MKRLASLMSPDRRCEKVRLQRIAEDTEKVLQDNHTELQ